MQEACKDGHHMCLVQAWLKSGGTSNTFYLDFIQSVNTYSVCIGWAQVLEWQSTASLRFPIIWGWRCECQKYPKGPTLAPLLGFASCQASWWCKSDWRCSAGAGETCAALGHNAQCIRRLSFQDEDTLSLWALAVLAAHWCIYLVCLGFLYNQ